MSPLLTPDHEFIVGKATARCFVALPMCDSARLVDVSVADSILSVEVEGLYQRLLVPIPPDVDEDSVECKFDKTARTLAVEMKLVNLSRDGASLEDTLTECEAEERAEVEAYETLFAQVHALEQAEKGQKELRAHLERVEREGPQNALEEDIEGLGLADPHWNDLEHWTRESRQTIAGESQARKSLESLSTVVAPLKAPEAPKAPKPRSLDYSKWDFIGEGSEEITQTSLQREEILRVSKLQALAEDLNSFTNGRTEREKERKQYWERIEYLKSL